VKTIPLGCAGSDCRHDDVVVNEPDPAAAGQVQLLPVEDRRHPVVVRRRVGRRRVVALEPENHRLDRPVAVAGRAQRAEQLRLDARHPGELAVGDEALREDARGAHRTDRVRGRRADADRVEVEDAQRHAITGSCDP
jgi:hypothetical protein